MIMIQLRNSTSGQTAWFPKITKETVDGYTKAESDARYVKKDDYNIAIGNIQKEIDDIPTDFKTINGESIVGQGDIEIRATIDSGSDLTVNTITTASGNVDTRIANNAAAINTVQQQGLITYRKISDSYSKTEVFTKSETNSQIDDKINRRIWTGTQAQYEATAKDSSTIYIITE